MGKDTILECLICIDALLPARIAECAGLEAEWSAIKKAWYKRALQDHPDKGGDPVTFRTVRSAFEVLRDLKDKNSIQSFIGSASAAYGSTGSSFDSNFSRFSTGPIPSWEFYSEAAEEAVPIYKVELAKSGRSKCQAKGSAISHTDESACIPKGTIRVGFIDLKSGAYGRWAHLACWRVPAKIWLGIGLGRASGAQQGASEDANTLLNLGDIEDALQGMNEVLLCGFSELSGPERTLFVQHVMNEKNWARERKERKPPGPGAISRAEHDAFSPGYEGTRNVFLSPDPPKSTQLVPHGLSARKSLAMPRPGIEAPAVCMAGITCVLTGTFPEAGGGAGLDFGKEKVRGLVQSFGGKVTGALSGRTKILIVGKDPGFSKVDKARQQPAQTSLLSLRDVIQRIVDGTIASTGPGNVQHMEIQSFSSGYGNNSLALLADAETYAIAAGTAAPQATIRNAANTAQVASVAQDSEDAVAAAELPGSSTGLATTTTTTTRSTITTTTTTTTTTSGKARGRPRGRKRARE